MTVLEIHLRDLGRYLVIAWHDAFAAVPGVSISQGDIFSTQSGRLRDHPPIDVVADAVVSRANSFGFMDRGIDAVAPTSSDSRLKNCCRHCLPPRMAGSCPSAAPSSSRRVTRRSHGASVHAPCGYPSQYQRPSDAHLAFRAACAPSWPQCRWMATNSAHRPSSPRNDDGALLLYAGKPSWGLLMTVGSPLNSEGRLFRRLRPLLRTNL